MQILKKLEKITEAATRQGIVINDILEDGTVISESPAYTRKYKLKESSYEDKDEDEMGEGRTDGWKLINKESGEEVAMGDKVKTFRGEDATVKSGTPPHKPSSTGRVSTDLGEHFPGVYGLKWVEDTVTEADEDDEDFPELELDDEESKVDYESKEDAARGIIDNIITGEFEAAHDALDDYSKLYLSDDGDEEESNDMEDDAELDGDMSGVDDDSMMDVREEGEEEELEESDHPAGMCRTCNSDKAIIKEGVKHCSKCGEEC